MMKEPCWTGIKRWGFSSGEVAKFETMHVDHGQDMLPYRQPNAMAVKKGLINVTPRKLGH